MVSIFTDKADGCTIDGIGCICSRVFHIRHWRTHVFCIVLQLANIINLLIKNVFLWNLWLLTQFRSCSLDLRLLNNFIYYVEVLKYVSYLHLLPANTVCYKLTLTATSTQYVTCCVKVPATQHLPLHCSKGWFHAPLWSQRSTASFLPSRKRLFSRQLYSTVSPTNINSPFQLFTLSSIAGGSGHTVSRNMSGGRWFPGWSGILMIRFSVYYYRWSPT